MDGVTQQNAAMVEEATAATRSLAAETEELASRIAIFRTGASMAPAATHAPANVHSFPALTPRAPASRRAAASRFAAAGALAIDESDWTKF